jgi:hypothetical protein
VGDRDEQREPDPVPVDQRPPAFSFLNLAQTLAAYLALPVVLLYPFGFVALFAQFTNYFRLDFYTAWYAASLVSRVVILGQGATILAVALIGSVLLSGVVAQILLRHDDSGRPGRFVRGRMLGAKLVLVSVLTLVLYVLYSRMLSAGRVFGPAILGQEPTECREEALRHQLNLWPDSLIPALIFVAGILWGGWLMYRSYRRYRQSVSLNEGRGPVADYRLRSTLRLLVRGITQRWILPGLVAAYTFGIVASLVLALYTPAFMPLLTYGGTPEYRGGKEPTHNRLLSYTDGNWHFLHRRKVEGGREYRVVSLTGGEAKFVRVRPYRATAFRVAPLPWSDSAVMKVTDPCEKQVIND